MNTEKPGSKTSEFVLTAIAQFVMFLAQVGVLTMADAQSLSASVVSVVTGVYAAISIFQYIRSRTSLKLGKKVDPAPVLPKQL
ncbi:MAG: hypothetical protein E6R03_15920 [Hyphomicrobiaceae bacterium]|nr:MAG: hypothetical protein E6R03_15920 [Hyphomicrobiaceae bacterium]